MKEAARLEREITDLEGEKSALEARLADTSFYSAGNQSEVNTATRRAAEVARLLAAAEERWLDVQSELEAIGEA
jgi:ATP-binding cassette subfamily F protein 3